MGATSASLRDDVYEVAELVAAGTARPRRCSPCGRTVTRVVGRLRLRLRLPVAEARRRAIAGVLVGVVRLSRGLRLLHDAAKKRVEKRLLDGVVAVDGVGRALGEQDRWQVGRLRQR